MQRQFSMAPRPMPPRQRFDRVAQFVAGFELSFGLELSSTMH